MSTIDDVRRLKVKDLYRSSSRGKLKIVSTVSCC